MWEGRGYLGGLALALCQYCNVRYPKGFEPAINFSRSTQIASNSVCTLKGPISSDLFCSLIFMLRDSVDMYVLIFLLDSRE